MLVRSGETSSGIVIQRLDQDGSQFCRALADRVVWLERDGRAYKISESSLLGGSGQLLASSESIPRDFSVRQRVEPPPSASLGALGFSFSETYTAPSYLYSQESKHINVKSASVEFHLEASLKRRTWFAHVPQDPKHFPAAERMWKTVVLGALALDFDHLTVPAHCLVVGVDILPKTALGTVNTFFVPWAAFVRGSDLKKAIGSCKTSRPVISKVQSGDQFYFTHELKKITRVSGAWIDVQIIKHLNPQ
jgi:hypothetical protein